MKERRDILLSLGMAMSKKKIGTRVVRVPQMIFMLKVTATETQMILYTVTAEWATEQKLTTTAFRR